MKLKLPLIIAGIPALIVIGGFLLIVSIDTPPNGVQFTDAVAEIHSRTYEIEQRQQDTFRAWERLNLAIHSETEAWQKLGEALENLRLEVE